MPPKKSKLFKKLTGRPGATGLFINKPDASSYVAPARVSTRAGPSAKPASEITAARPRATAAPRARSPPRETAARPRVSAAPREYSAYETPTPTPFIRQLTQPSSSRGDQWSHGHDSLTKTLQAEKEAERQARAAARMERLQNQGPSTHRAPTTRRTSGVRSQGMQPDTLPLYLPTRGDQLVREEEEEVPYPGATSQAILLPENGQQSSRKRVASTAFPDGNDMAANTTATSTKRSRVSTTSQAISPPETDQQPSRKRSARTTFPDEDDMVPDTTAPARKRSRVSAAREYHDVQVEEPVEDVAPVSTEEALYTEVEGEFAPWSDFESESEYDPDPEEVVIRREALQAAREPTPLVSY